MRTRTPGLPPGPGPRGERGTDAAVPLCRRTKKRCWRSTLTSSSPDIFCPYASSRLAMNVQRQPGFEFKTNALTGPPTSLLLVKSRAGEKHVSSS
jgi:hypothetical protein